MIVERDEGKFKTPYIHIYRDEDARARRLGHTITRTFAKDTVDISLSSPWHLSVEQLEQELEVLQEVLRQAKLLEAEIQKPKASETPLRRKLGRPATRAKPKG